jgi:hypothetical protein
MVKGDARLEEIDMLWEITQQIEVGGIGFRLVVLLCL